MKVSDYKIEFLIENGGKSKVFAARDKNGNLVALKTMEKSEFINHKNSAIKNEVEILKSLSHENILKLLDFITTEDFYILVFPYCSYGDLFSLLKSKGVFSEELTRSIIIQIINSLEYLHSRGIVHRDVKLENIFIHSINDSDGFVQVILGDFGLAKVINDSTTKTPCGTFDFAAPEVVTELEYSKKIDMWSLGCLCFTLLGGYAPFFTDKYGTIDQKIRKGYFSFASPVWDNVSEEAKDFISKLLQVVPSKRLDASSAMKHPWITGQCMSQAISSRTHTPRPDAKKSMAFRPNAFNCLWSPIPESLKTPINISTAQYFPNAASKSVKNKMKSIAQSENDELRELVNAPIEHYNSMCESKSECEFKLDFESSKWFKKHLRNKKNQ